MSSRLLAQLPPPEFVPDARFAPPAEAVPSLAQAVVPDGGDPLREAWQRGLAEGEQAAAQRHAAELEDLAARYAALDRAFVRLGEENAEDLRDRLRQVVIALCESAIRPMALDRDALAQRIERAAALLLRASDDRRIRIHPADLELVRDRIDPGLMLEPDASLERGALRIETETGGIEDGPEIWQRAIREALGEC